MNNNISVIVVTKNEEDRIGTCLKKLRPYFSNIWVVDSNSSDKTKKIARGYGAQVINFVWNGAYPKKYGWCLEQMQDLEDWVLFIDADEWMTEKAAHEIKSLSLDKAGYFLKARYSLGNKILRFGLFNNKLCLINRHKMKFSTVKDLNIQGMDEIEGHYQPVLRAGYKKEKIGKIKNYIHHDIDISSQEWVNKHKRYARWEAEMDVKNLWPKEDKASRQFLKFLFKRLPFRPSIAFLHSYIIKLGFLDGWDGLDFAMSRYRYYSFVDEEKRALKANKL